MRTDTLYKCLFNSIEAKDINHVLQVKCILDLYTGSRSLCQTLTPTSSCPLPHPQVCTCERRLLADKAATPSFCTYSSPKSTSLGAQHACSACSSAAAPHAPPGAWRQMPGPAQGALQPSWVPLQGCGAPRRIPHLGCRHAATALCLRVHLLLEIDSDSVLRVDTILNVGCQPYKAYVVSLVGDSDSISKYLKWQLVYLTAGELRMAPGQHLQASPQEGG